MGAPTASLRLFDSRRGRSSVSRDAAGQPDRGDM